jgi:hypothetical protein
MSTPTKVSLHKIEHQDNIPFSEDDYSRFKYGDGMITNQYAKELTPLISKLLSSHNPDDDVIIYPSPFSFLPTASCHMTFKIFEELKIIHPLFKFKISKIERKNSYPQDYGEMNKIERYNLIKNDTYDFEDIPNCKSKLIFIDDISITGTHQLIIEEILKNKDINNISYFLYYAIVTNNEIDPRIENRLNYHYVNNVKILVELIEQEKFLLNTRFVKKILSLNSDELIEFINSINTILGKERLQMLIEGSLKNNYELIPEFKYNLNLLIKESKKI